MRLLLAAAQTDLRLSLELLLSEQPGVVIVGTASESEGLLALIKTSEPDLILTDWDLPGRSLAGILTERKQTTHFPKTIILTASNRDRRAALAAGADAAVLKGGPPGLLLQEFQSIRSQTAQ